MFQREFPGGSLLEWEQPELLGGEQLLQLKQEQLLHQLLPEEWPVAVQQEQLASLFSPQLPDQVWETNDELKDLDLEFDVEEETDYFHASSCLQWNPGLASSILFYAGPARSGNGQMYNCSPEDSCRVWTSPCTNWSCI